MVTVEQLKSLYSYDPETGNFFHLRIRTGVPDVTKPAGSLHEKGYVMISVGGKQHYGHRMAFLFMTGEYPPKDIDHKNGKRNDNRWCNLRAATRFENMRNKHIHRDTGVPPGISWSIGLQQWCAHLRIGKRKVGTGYAARKYGFLPAMKMAVLKLREYEKQLDAPTEVLNEQR